MKHRLLGKDLEVSAVGLGCMVCSQLSTIKIHSLKRM